MMVSAAFAQGVSLSLSSASATPGSSVTLDLTLDSGQATLAGVQWTIHYWPVDISSIQVSAGPAALTAGKPVICGNGTGNYTCLVAGINGGTISGGVLAQVTVHVASSAVDSASAIRISEAVGVSPDAEPIPVVAAGAVLTIRTVQLSSLTCNARSVTAPGTTNCTVTLSAAAGPAGATFTLSSGSPDAMVPASATVPAGATSVAFSLSASQVKAAELARVTATVGSSAVIADVVLVPPDSAVAAIIVVSAAQSAPGPVAPGELVTVYGYGMGPANGMGAVVQSGKVGTAIGGASVLFDGNPAPLLYARSDQVNAVVPFGVANRTSTQVQVRYGGAVSNVLTVPVAATSPGIFTMNASGSGQGAILNHDGSVNSTANPAAPGSVVTIYATGGGITNPSSPDGSITGTDVLPSLVNPVSVWIGDVQTEVLYRGAAPTFVAGALQINARVPTTITPGPNVPVKLVIGKTQSQAGVTLAVQ
jgi:uncharacterized protein (TIGR03437 family)